MNIELLQKEIKAAKRRISKDKEYVRTTEYEIAKFFCPYSIGDAVFNKAGEKEIISSISYCSWGEKHYEFKTFKTKKNGEPYKVEQYVNNYDGYTKAI